METAPSSDNKISKANSLKKRNAIKHELLGQVHQVYTSIVIGTIYRFNFLQDIAFISLIKCSLRFLQQLISRHKKKIDIYYIIIALVYVSKCLFSIRFNDEPINVRRKPNHVKSNHLFIQYLSCFNYKRTTKHH